MLKSSSLRWHDPDRFNGCDLSPRDADTPVLQSVPGGLPPVKRSAAVERHYAKMTARADQEE
jgi:hypothetical protein